jgi:hypothetical protein
MVMRMTELERIDALRPPCPTCGGRATVNADRFDHDPLLIPCPDCSDGRVPWERLVKVFEAVHEGDLSRYNGEGGPEVVEYLRVIR